MDLLEDIEATLDQLILNEESLLSLEDEDALSIEKEALIKMQESLRAHLFFLKDAYKQTKKRIETIAVIEKKKSIFTKAKYFHRISDFSIPLFAEEFRSTSIRLRKNRLKKSLSTAARV